MATLQISKPLNLATSIFCAAGHLARRLASQARGPLYPTRAEISLSHLWTLPMNSLTIMDSATLSGKTSPASSPLTTTHSGAFWLDLLEQANPSFLPSTSLPPESQTAPTGGPPNIRPIISSGRAAAWSLDPKDAPPGLSKTLNTTAWPNDASVSSLSQILETGPIQRKYYLSALACRGILRRAEKRGKELPEPLQRALAAVAALEPISTLMAG